MKLDQSQVIFHPLSYADPSGRLFCWEGNLYRAIHQDRAAFYKRLLSEGILQELAGKNLIVDSEPTELELDGYAMVLKHRTVPFVSYCYEWCGEMLRKAALLVLKLEEELLNYRLTLQDASPRNVLFDGTTPLWVDLGSLIPVAAGEQWRAYNEEFLAFFSRPLKLMAAGHSHVARCLMQDEYRGIDQREFQMLAGSGNNFARTVTERTKSIAKKLLPRTYHPFVGQAARRLAGGIPSIGEAVRDIEKIPLHQPSTRWSDYYEDERYSYSTNCVFPNFSETTDWTEKHRAIAQIISTKNPGSVLDIGSNRGWYSQLAARNGAQVVGIDHDEPAVTAMFSDAEREQLSILPLLIDFRRLISVSSSRRIGAVENLRCDMVLALALVHHLVFGQLLKFDQVVTNLSAFVRKWLVVEFIDPDDHYVKEWMTPQFAWYSYENFKTFLAKEFSSIESFPSYPEHRRILLCER